MSRVENGTGSASAIVWRNRAHEVASNVSAFPAEQEIPSSKRRTRKRRRNGRTRSREDIVFAFDADVGPFVVVVFGRVRDLGDVRQDRVRVCELEQVDQDHGVVVTFSRQRAETTGSAPDLRGTFFET